MKDEVKATLVAASGGSASSR